MLERSIWRQYNQTNNFREMVGTYCKLEQIDLIEDDKQLYSALKTKLTKKELKLFAMSSAKVADDEIMREFGADGDELKQLLFKLHKKLKQDKTKLALKADKFDDSSID